MASLNPVTGVLGRARAAHLLRRCTMGLTLQSLNQFESLTVQNAVTTLLQPSAAPPPPVDPLTGSNWVSPAPTGSNSSNDDLANYTRAWWLETMRTSGNSLTERMTYFYHTHIPTILSRLPQAASLYYQIALYRYYSLGNYRDLMKAVCIDNAMLVHLDGVLNIAGLPQENFAREFMELFTVGKGPQIGPENYTTFTEDDVRAATKVLTGWDTDHTFTSTDPVTGLARGKVKLNGSSQAFRHDVSTKQFSAAFQNTTISPSAMSGGFATEAAVYTELNDFINMVFSQNATALHFCRKLYRHFVYYAITPEIETDIIAPMASLLLSSNYNVAPVLSLLLQSEHFFDMDTPQTDDNNIGAIIKSPADLVIGMLRTFGVTMPSATSALALHYEAYTIGILPMMFDQGMDLYEPYDVAGYDAYFQEPAFNRNWITPNYLAMRYKFSDDLIMGVENQSSVMLFRLDVVDFVANNVSNPANPDTLVQELTELMFPIQITTDRFDYFRDDILLDQLSAINWANEWNNYISSGNDTNVRVQLEALFRALMQCPEYQIY